MIYLEKLHILYTDKNGKFKQCEKRFHTIELAEDWLRSIGAKYWEIGFLDLSDNAKI